MLYEPLQPVRDAQNMCIIAFLRVPAKWLRCEYNADMIVSLCLSLIECRPCALTVAVYPEQRPRHEPGLIDVFAGCWSTKLLADARRDSAASSLLSASFYHQMNLQDSGSDCPGLV